MRKFILLLIQKITLEICEFIFWSFFCWIIFCCNYFLLELFFVGTIFCWNYFFRFFIFLQFYFFYFFLESKMTNHLIVDFSWIFKKDISQNDIMNFIKAIDFTFSDKLFESKNLNVEMKIDYEPKIEINDTKISIKSTVRKKW
ncbi:MAG: hypothetical protein Ta2E_01460 [Mycoplasmoidaceae bacterium]|nr:MAG: hypothetical protein Ta2E_01460 [Mycoplasmoidaceae bacterium]